MENLERKYEIGEFVIAHIGGNVLKGRISRQNNFDIMRINEYFVHTILGTFLIDDEYIFEYFENN